MPELPITEKDKVIYQYKLVKKVQPHPTVSALYWMLFLAAVAAGFAFGGESLSVWAIASAVVWQCIYVIVTKILLARDADSSSLRSRYQWRFGFAWVGYFPIHHVPFRQYRSVILHLFWLGIAVSCLLFVWTTPAAAVTVAGIHVWSLLRAVNVALIFQFAASPGAVISYSTASASLHVR